MNKSIWVLLVGTALAAGLPASAQGPTPTVQNQSTTPDPYRKPPPQLSEAEQRFVVQAAVEAKSRQKTPKGFSPALGAEVPREIDGHGFQPDVSEKLPVLKEYQYAFLDHEILLINALERKIVAVVPLPQEFVSETTGGGGATNPSPDDPEKAKAYTSPQSNK